MAAVLGPVYTVGQQVLARPGSAIAQGGTIEQRTITILEVLTGDRYRVAYGAVKDLIVHASSLQPIAPSARATDPGTSHAAARNASKPWKLYAGQRRALHAIVMAGDRGLNDFELAARTGSKQTSIGVRRGEIAKAGLVRRTGNTRPSDTLEPADVWVATDLGRQVWRELCGKERDADERGAA